MNPEQLKLVTVKAYRKQLMFHTFLQNCIRDEEKIDPYQLSKLSRGQDNGNLWLARKVCWPLQKIHFKATVSTPRKLSCLEKILLHIFWRMQDSPPDSSTIATQLAVHDEYFIDQTIKELVLLGAMKTETEGRSYVTDLGCECHNRGQLPSQPRRRKFSIVFDPVAQDFPNICDIYETVDSDKSPDSKALIVPRLQIADPNRIDLDAIRRAVKIQGLLTGSDEVIFDARPQQSSQKNKKSSLTAKEVYLLVFINDKGRINLYLHAPNSKDFTKWSQKVIETRSTETNFNFLHLFGSLQESKGPDSCVSSGNYFSNPQEFNLIPAHQVQNRILEVLTNAEDELIIQISKEGEPIEQTSLLESIQEAGRRGVHCKLLWDNKLSGYRDKIENRLLTCENIEHRLVSTFGEEILLADDNLVFTSSVSNVQLPSDKMCHLRIVSESKNSFVCRRLKEQLQNKWNNSSCDKDSVNQTIQIDNLQTLQEVSL